MRALSLSCGMSAALLVVFSGQAIAQSSGAVTIDVPVQWTTASDEPTNSRNDFGAALEFVHLFAGERGRLFYEMTMDSFGAPEGLRTWLHNAGVMHTFGGDRRAFDLGGSFFWRANDDSWGDAGFRGVNLLASARVKPVDALTVSTSYALYVRAFQDQPSLDQTEHYGSVRALANLQTRTTLVAVVSLGRKAYDGRASVPVSGEAALDAAPASAHMGRGWRQSLQLPPLVETVGAPGARTEWSWAARIAQSLDDRTGVWIEREERRTRGDLPPTIVWTPPMFYEDGVYDDPYVVDARTWRAGARHVFASGRDVSAWASESDRSYAGLERRDTLRRAGLDAIVPLVAGARGELSLVAGYTYFHNHSSEILESYRAHQASVGVKVGF